MSPTFDVREHVIEASHIREYPRATANTQEDPLLLHIKQYIPRGYDSPQKGDLTIIGAHANGFPKELYEPLWEDLLQQLRKHGVRLRAIWVCDAASQGRSGILNREYLGNDPGWFDYSRDITHMINTFRMPRPIMAVAHSFGATVMTNVALNHPRLFSSLVMIDPVMEIPHKKAKERYTTPTWLSARRRDLWPSLEAAADSFRQSKFYQAWDKRALELWIQYGLIPNPDRKPGSNEVVLATTRHQEVFTFQRPSFQAFGPDGIELLDRDAVPDMDHAAGENAQYIPLYRPEMPMTFVRLPHVRPNVLYIFGGTSYVSQEAQREEKLNMTGSECGGSGGRKAGRVDGVVGTKHGHLIPFQAPGFCAEHAATWAVKTIERWRKEEEEYEAWARKSSTEKTTVSQEVMDKIKPPKPRGKEKGKVPSETAKL